MIYDFSITNISKRKDCHYYYFTFKFEGETDNNHSMFMYFTGSKIIELVRFYNDRKRFNQSHLDQLQLIISDLPNFRVKKIFEQNEFTNEKALFHF